MAETSRSWHVVTQSKPGARWECVWVFETEAEAEEYARSFRADGLLSKVIRVG